MTEPIFKNHAPLYREAGYHSRPVKPGAKACKEKGWSKPDGDLTQGTYDKWLKNRPGYGIGLRLGSTFADGTRLGALDIDDDRYTRLAEFLLGDPPSGRVGQKGIAFFVRLKGPRIRPRTPFEVPVSGSAKTHVGELLGDGGLLVIPPTIHPQTDQPYRWVGKPLLETSYDQLPIIEV